VTGLLDRLNGLPAAEAEAQFLSCCGSSEWARRMTAARPFRDASSLAETADRTWRQLSPEDWREAFAAHPAIGGSEKGTDLFSATSAKTKKNAKTNLSPFSRSPFSRQEQSGTRGADSNTLAELADLNRRYAERFGHVFLVCATGRTAAEMLAIGRERFGNDPETELAIAAEEQRKITRLRLEKLLGTEA
jgi:OHCU decarboxylase